MKTTLACIALVFVLTFHGQLVSTEEKPPNTSKDDPPIDAADVPPTDEVSGDQENMSPTNSAEERIVLAEVSGDQESNIAESPVSRTSYGSIYGSYNQRRCCWKTGPEAPYLKVRRWGQSEVVRRKIECLLAKNKAVKQAVSKNAMNCEKRSKGLLDNCPSRYYRATEVLFYFRQKCYIVRPDQQCVTYRECKETRTCAARGIVKRSSLDDVINRRGKPQRKDPCSRKSFSSSVCLPDGYRTFQVWIYCDFCGFKLINLRLPQCCSCKRYNQCGRG